MVSLEVIDHAGYKHDVEKGHFLETAARPYTPRLRESFGLTKLDTASSLGKGR
jgi:hypothetical protein